MSRRKISVAEQIAAAKACAERRINASELARRVGMSRTGIQEWTARYKAGGESAFEITGKNHV